MDVWLQQVAERIYDAALDERLWADLVETISRSFDDRPFYLLQADTRTRRTDLVRTANLDASYARQYLGEFAHLDSNGVGALQSFARIGEVAKPLQLMSEQALRAQPVIQSVYEPVGVMPDWGTKLADDQETIAACGFHRRSDQAPMSTEQIRLFLPLIPHFIHAARVMGRFRALNESVRSLRQGLDALGEAVFVVGEGGRLHEANAAAGKGMQSDGPVRLVDGRVTLRHPVATRTLYTLVQDAFETGSKRELVLDSRNGGRHLVEIIPAREAPALPALVVVVHRARDELLDHRLGALSSELGLSRRQSLVARHLVEGESYEEIAGRLRRGMRRGFRPGGFDKHPGTGEHDGHDPLLPPARRPPAHACPSRSGERSPLWPVRSLLLIWNPRDGGSRYPGRRLLAVDAQGRTWRYSMTSGDPPKGDDDQGKPAVSPGRGEQPVNDSALAGGKAEVVSLDRLRRRQRGSAPDTDPDPGDDPGPAAA